MFRPPPDGKSLAMSKALAVEVRNEQGGAIVTAAGEIGVSTVIPLRQRLFEVAAGGGSLLVDLNQVSVIDAVGLASLVGAARSAAAHGGHLQVACAAPKIRQLVRLTGLDC
jgi:anti-anti-sigma factor